MAFLGKEYTFVKQENFEDFLKFSGVPAERVGAGASFAPPVKFEKSGDSYVYYTQNLAGPKVTTFSSGVEFDDAIGADSIPMKCKFVVDGNTITQTISNAKGSATFKREFTDNELVVTITADNWDGVAKRFYKA